MLKLTRKVEYALIALSHMHNKRDGSTTNTAEIASEYMIPQEILAKTLQQMAQEGIVKSILGPSGGYRLEEGVGEMSLMQIIEILEGPVGLVDCNINANCTQLDHCNIRRPIGIINERIKSTLNSIKFEDITH